VAHGDLPNKSNPGALAMRFLRIWCGPRDDALRYCIRTAWRLR
jgi:hypothetical protein